MRTAKIAPDLRLRMVSSQRLASQLDSRETGKYLKSKQELKSIDQNLRSS